MSDRETVLWHDLECGGYLADLELWCELAAASGDPILDVGAGTGRVSLELARRGHRVLAVDHDPVLLAALERRGAHLDSAASARLSTLLADARSLEIPGDGFSLVVVPMQTIQLLGGASGRRAFFIHVRQLLGADGMLAIALAPAFEEFVLEEGEPGPLPDIVELEGTVYASQPTAVRVDGDTVVLERRREIIDPHGGRRVSEDRIALDVLGPGELIAEATRAGLTATGTRTVAETDEHVGSLVVSFRA